MQTLTLLLMLMLMLMLMQPLPPRQQRGPHLQVTRLVQPAV